MSSLLNKRLIFVTGKGGVGKSTVSAALGLVAAKRGKRTIICEVAQQERMSQYFHSEEAGFTEKSLAENLFAISIDPDQSMEEYLRLQVKIKPLADLLFSNRIFHYFAAATPGMKEIVTIGKIWELAQLDRRTKKADSYDLVIVDAPATGHGLAMLSTPRFFSDVAKVGPIKRQADIMHNFITDSERTGVVAVALPEEMVVSETVELQHNLKEKMGIDLDRIFLNGLYPKRYTKAEGEILETAFEACGDPLARAAVRSAISEQRRAIFQKEQAKKLDSDSGLKSIKLPFLFEPDFDVEHFDQLSTSIEAAL